MSVIIKDGQFYRNGKLEPAKFGDPDQIKALKKANELRANPTAELTNHECTIYTAIIKFTCPECMHGNYCEVDEQEDFEFDSVDMDGQDVTCSRCKHVYELKENDGILKLIS